MNFQETGYDDLDWINVALDRFRWWAFVNMVMNFWIP
jgi:hypothetical protein